jgi:hypothetical protein
LRYLAATLFVATLGFAPAAMAAPNSINDCEKIEAADAYNRCLASFGPVAHLHGGSAKDFGGDGDPGAAAGAEVVQAADPEASVPRERRSAHSRHNHGHWTQHYHGHYHHYAHYHGHGHGSAHASHGGRKRLAFNVTSHHARAR